MLSIVDSAIDYTYDVSALTNMMLKVDDDVDASSNDILTATSFANVEIK